MAGLKLTDQLFSGDCIIEFVNLVKTRPSIRDDIIQYLTNQSCLRIIMNPKLQTFDECTDLSVIIAVIFSRFKQKLKRHFIVLKSIQKKTEEEFRLVVFWYFFNTLAYINDSLFILPQHIQTFRPFLQELYSLRIHQQSIGEVRQPLLIAPHLTIYNRLHKVILRNIILRFLNRLEYQIQLRFMPIQHYHRIIEIVKRVICVYPLSNFELVQSQPEIFLQMVSFVIFSILTVHVVFLHVADCLVEVGLDAIQIDLGLLEFGAGLFVEVAIAEEDALAYALVVFQR